MDHRKMSKQQKHPMTPADARRIQSATDRNTNATPSAKGFKERAMRTAETSKKR